MPSVTLEQIVENVPMMNEADRWRLFAELSKSLVTGEKGSARDLLGTLEPASSIDPQERVRRLRAEWDS